MRQLSALDRLFLTQERPGAPMHTSLLLFYSQETAPGGRVRLRDIVQVFADRAAEVPLLHCRVHDVPLELDKPYWVHDENFNVESHVNHVALPKPGDFDLAIAVEQRPPERPPPGFQRLETRIVAVGGSSFLLDQYFLAGSHRDFLLNAVAWLTGEEEKATVGGQAWAERMLKSSPGVQSFPRWVPTLLLAGVFLCIGAFVYYLRRA